MFFAHMVDVGVCCQAHVLMLCCKIEHACLMLSCYNSVRVDMSLFFMMWS